MQPTPNIEQMVRDYLPTVIHMSLGTCNNGKPWVCEVHFAYDHALHIYWRSLPSRRHSQEIAGNPNVAGNKDIHVAYPFAEPCFATQLRKPNPKGTVRILFAGRLSAQKGIYTFLEALHLDIIVDNPHLTFTVTTAGADKPEGNIIRKLVEAHPNVTVIPARKTPAAMAELMAAHDIIVMPSNSQYWHETFGIVSIEAQHTGCRVVASDDGGLPETNCGGVILVKPDDAEALAQGIQQAIDKGPSPDALRRKAAILFTVEQSVDNLLQVLFPPEELIVQPIEKIVLKTSVKVVPKP